MGAKPNGQRRAAKNARRRKRREREAPTRGPEDDDGTDELFELLWEQAADAVARTLDTRDAGAARRFTARILDADEHVSGESAQENPGAVAAITVLLEWLTSASERADLRGGDVTAWLTDDLGLDAADLERARAFAGAVHGTDAARLDALLADEIEGFLPVLVWLAAAAVARHGDGDLTWLASLEDDDPA